ncbi:hypothetical protein [Neisseria montereyensis]|uniref:Uncharacterized protein n=1 Tax=Neisseria montereyensis TaxID=2973938 RepID=A0ABT2F9B6_9NEIS|nr:hypothetical protein [Neisseria montereyensis]MCS4532732.1 hypothetical protein [Neisseria montereyensis]
MKITIHLNARLQPMHRHDIEDLLEEFLPQAGIKAKVVGGGTALEENGEIASCDIDLNIPDSSDETIGKIISFLEGVLAPIGSYIIVYSRFLKKEVKRVPFGIWEGLGLYLNGSDLDIEVYQNCDVNHVYKELERLLEEDKKGMIASYWEGGETALYLYGKSFDEMYAGIKSFIDSYPLCQKSRVVKIA